MYLIINKWVIAVKVSNFSGQYLRNHRTLDIGFLGYIGIVWPKEHSPEVRSFPPGTPCIYISHNMFYQFHSMDCGIQALFRGEFAVWSQGKWNVTECTVPMFAVLLFQQEWDLRSIDHLVCKSLSMGTQKPIKIMECSAELLGKSRLTSYNYVDVCTKFTYGKHGALYVYCLPE